MPVPAPNLYPAFNTIRLSHACLNVADLEASKRFYTDILGLQVTDETPTHLYLRAMEERGHHCLILQKSDAQARYRIQHERARNGHIVETNLGTFLLIQRNHYRE